jgi:hypothetical protein
MKKTKLFLTITALTLAVLLLLSGCGKESNSSSGGAKAGQSANYASLSLDTSDMFTERDLETGYDESTATKITLSDTEPNAEITQAGTYIITGSATDGSITVTASDDDKVQLVLNGVTLTSKTSAALYVKSADKVFLTTAKGTNNILSNGGAFDASGDDNIDGAIFSKSDIVFNGEGTLTVKCSAAHGIVGKDDVKFTSGEYVIECEGHGVDANDSIRITNATLKITSGKDGLHSDNDEDASKGYVYIESGTLNINSDDDAVHAVTTLQIAGGTLNIKAAEGLEATVVIIDGGTISIEASDDGINAAKKFSGITPTVIINGGSIKIVMGQGDTDGIDSNGNIEINGGTVDITGNSSFDYDGTGIINGGTVTVNGKEITELPNQMAGGAPGGMRGNDKQNGMRGGAPGGSSDAITSATPDKNNPFPGKPDSDGSGFSEGQLPEAPGFKGGENGERPQKPDSDSSTEGAKKAKPPRSDSNGESEKTKPGKST